MGSTPELDNKIENVTDEPKVVSAQAYKEVSADLHKFKEQKKALEQEVQRLKAEEAARNEAEALKKGEFQKVADDYRKKFEESEAKRQAEMKRVIDLQKLHSIDAAIGGFQRPEYSKIAVNLEALKVTEDGFIDQESLKAEADRIKREHAVLLKNHSTQKLPAQASQGSSDPLSYKEQVKQCKSIAELTALMEKHKKV